MNHFKQKKNKREKYEQPNTINENKTKTTLNKTIKANREQQKSKQQNRNTQDGTQANKTKTKRNNKKGTRKQTNENENICRKQSTEKIKKRKGTITTSF